MFRTKHFRTFEQVQKLAQIAGGMSLLSDEAQGKNQTYAANWQPVSEDEVQRLAEALREDRLMINEDECRILLHFYPRTTIDWRARGYSSSLVVFVDALFDYYLGCDKPQILLINQEVIDLLNARIRDDRPKSDAEEEAMMKAALQARGNPEITPYLIDLD